MRSINISYIVIPFTLFLFLLLLPTQALADHAYCIRFEARDRVCRGTERLLCDENWEEKGFAGGILRPVSPNDDIVHIKTTKCPVCELARDTQADLQPFLCEGVGAPTSVTVDSQFGTFTIVSTTIITLDVAGAQEPPPVSLNVTVVDVNHPNEPAYHRYDPDNLMASAITYVLGEGATPLQGGCTVNFSARVAKQAGFILLDNFCFP